MVFGGGIDKICKEYNKIDFSEDYLKKLAEIPIPEGKKGMGKDKEAELHYYYCHLKYAAEELLKNPLDREAKKKLSELIKKLGISMDEGKEE